MNKTIITFAQGGANLKQGSTIVLSHMDTRRWKRWLYAVVFFGRRKPYRKVTRRVTRVINDTTVELDGD